MGQQPKSSVEYPNNDPLRVVALVVDRRDVQETDLREGRTVVKSVRKSALFEWRK